MPIGINIKTIHWISKAILSALIDETDMLNRSNGPKRLILLSVPQPLISLVVSIFSLCITQFPVVTS